MQVTKTRVGQSLNEYLNTGLTLTAKLHNILRKFRELPYTIPSDINKVFHHIKIYDQKYVEGPHFLNKF